MQITVLMGVSVLLAGVVSSIAMATGVQPATSTTPQGWPHINSTIAQDAAIEARITEILTSMTLAQKIGQMTQAEIKSVTPEQVRQYYLGSVLNGGGSWPGMNKHATLADWLNLADRYHQASMSTDARYPVPVIWGTDAVHGHNNVMGATLFPHNIGLGAAHDPELVGRIGRATAEAIRASGIHWAFAPTLAVVQDPRWGRTYESFSSDPLLVRAYAKTYVAGMQGDLRGDGTAIATAKHFIGDGATEHGKDQGVSIDRRAEMINIHGQGYYGALESGVQTVMASYNSWNDVANGVDYGKMHGAKPLLTDALKGEMGFDGFVVSDWNAIAQVPGCTVSSCPQAINAGIDMVMAPDDWMAFIANTTKQVEDGTIPMARIDDAVSRILRVKLRAGLFDRKPSDGQYAGNTAALVHRDLAREAVRKSLVLLKNNRNALPLHKGQRVLVVGKSADNLANQAGGWSLTWQGTENAGFEYRNGTSVLGGLRDALGADKISYDPWGFDTDPSQVDVVVAVIGETPYAETNGDLSPAEPVTHSRWHPEDLATLRAASALRKPVVTIFISGRPLYANDLLNLSDAFVAAWLPGSEGGGIADVLVADGRKPRYDFTGRLPFSWPGVPCPAAEDRPDPARPPLFARGYGLNYASAREQTQLPPPNQTTCGKPAIAIFNGRDAMPYTLQVRAGDQIQALGTLSESTLSWPHDRPAVRVSNARLDVNDDARNVTWLAPARLFAASPYPWNYSALARADASLQFDVVVEKAPNGPVMLVMGCGRACGAGIDISSALSALSLGTRTHFNVPLRCFVERGLGVGGVDVPFSVSAQPPFAATFGNIALVTGGARQANALDCDQVR